MQKCEILFVFIRLCYLEHWFCPHIFCLHLASVLENWIGSASPACQCQQTKLGETERKEAVSFRWTYYGGFWLSGWLKGDSHLTAMTAVPGLMGSAVQWAEEANPRVQIFHPLSSFLLYLEPSFCLVRLISRYVSWILRNCFEMCQKHPCAVIDVKY